MENNHDQIRKTARYLKTARELFIIFVLSLVVYIIAAHYDILEQIVALTNKHETWQLDEFITVAIFLAFALAIFSLRRWRDLLASERNLKLQNKELQTALKEIRQLKGIIPICSSCKKIRDDEGYWHQVEVYIRDHSEAEFSHGICPDCMRKLYPQYVKDDLGGKNNPN